jgi:hypothetical protein
MLKLRATARRRYFASDQRVMMLVSLTNRTGWWPA